MSDHNVLNVRVSCEYTSENDYVAGRRWSSKGVDRDGYVSELREYANENGLNVRDDANVDELLKCVMSWVQVANERRLKEIKRVNIRKPVWWSSGLERMKKCARKTRKQFQNARRRRVDVSVIEEEYKRCMREYKSEICRVKEKNRQQFVRK